MGCCGKVRGAVKLVQSEMGIGVADQETIGKRRKVCESCDRWEHGRCQECGCFTYSKTRLSNEVCPLEKW